METKTASETHWADRIAGEVIAGQREPVMISTGISPSGDIHIGNMREVMTGDAIHRVLLERGVAAGFHFVADNLDPLRKVYPFLDPAVYEPLVGRPICAIPCPCGDHASYADHFLDPFLEALEALHVRPQIVRSDELYRSGRMNRYISLALEQRDRIAAILEELTGRRSGDGWSPFNPLCPSCGRINQSTVERFSTADETIDFRCACGSAGRLPMAGAGKLSWRVDWPARWCALGVTVEPFGKDHATRGGSYESGTRIIREVFGGEPPYPVPYEWISLKGRGDMSSSKGNVLSIGRILEVVPPEALRYMVIRDRPMKRISFDPGIPLLKLVDEVDDPVGKDVSARALELSRAGGFESVGVPFKHLVVVAQAAAFDVQTTVDTLRRTGYPASTAQAVEGRMEYARRWLDSFAPEEMKFTVQPSLPAEAKELSPVQRDFLGRLASRLDAEMDGERIHNLIHGLAREFADVKPAEMFRAIYLALLGKPRGPRAGEFISLLGAEFCANRFDEASGGDP